MTPLKPYLVTALHQWIIDNGLTPYLLVDCDVEGVVVPSAYINDGRIILNAHPNAVDDWLSDETAISFSARFSGLSEQIYIPISAVLATYAKENGKGMMFDERFEDDDMPPEPDGPKPKTSSEKPVLKVVK